MWNNAASSSDGCQFVSTGEEAHGHGGVRVYWVLVVFWSRFVSVWRLDSGELLMSADRVRHGVMESKGPFVAISKQPTCRERQIGFCQCDTGQPLDVLSSGWSLWSQHPNASFSLPVSLSNFPFNGSHSFSSPSLSLASEEPPVFANSQKRAASKINTQTGRTPPRVSPCSGMRLFY